MPPQFAPPGATCLAYHCFPRRETKDIRRGSGKLHLTSEYRLAGLRVLRSILDHGLLLSCEDRLMARDDPLQPSAKDEVRALQYRASFTMLKGDDLYSHSLFFGAFGIGVDLTTLRRVGAVPVFYLPAGGGTGDRFERVGASLIFRLLEATNVLERLDRLVRGPEPHPHARRVLDELAQGVVSTEDLAGALRFLSNILYLTEELDDADGMLRYYRQLEWRIIAGLNAGGASATRPLTAREIVDRFGDTRAARQAHIVEQIDQRPFSQAVATIACPADCVAAVRSMLEELCLAAEIIGVDYG